MHCRIASGGGGMILFVVRKGHLKAAAALS